MTGRENSCADLTQPFQRCTKGDMQRPGRVAEQATAQLTRLDRTRLYWAQRQDGQSVADSARIAGISRQTGWRLEKVRREQTIGEAVEKASHARVVPVLRKQEACERLTKLAETAEAERDRINAIALLGRFQGYEAPTVTMSITVPTGVVSWLDQLDARLLPNTTTPQLDEHTQPALPAAPADKVCK